MVNEIRQHPSLEVLATLAEGRLGHDEKMKVTKHLAHCEECYALFASTAKFVEETREESEEQVVPFEERRRRMLVTLAAAAAIMIVSLLALVVLRNVTRDPLSPVVETANALPYRLTEGRLSGDFAYRPLQPVTRGTGAQDPKRLRLQGAAGEVLDAETDAKSQAVAQLLIGNARGAVELLERRLPQTPNDPALQNDLSVAYLALAAETNDRSSALKALTASDKALKLDPGSVTARFNRAVALEDLGLHPEAAKAWSQYLEVDSTSEWATEARSRLQRLQVRSEREAWKEAEATLATFLGHGNRDAIAAIVTRYPSHARRWGEGVYLPAWADLFSSGRSDEASRQLSLAREIGAALVRSSGEALLRDSVVHVDKAVKLNDPVALAKLTRGLIEFREGRILQSRNQTAEAERRLRKAAEELEAAGSPMSLLAHKFLGGTLYEQMKLTECREHLDRMAALGLDRRGYKALHAEIGWERGLSRVDQGDPESGAEILRTSRALAAQLGERPLQSSLDSCLAYVEELLGRRAEAWRHRHAALVSLWKDGDEFRRQVTIDTYLSALARARRWDETISIADAVLPPGDGALTLPQRHALHARGVAHAQRGDEAAAARDAARLVSWSRQETDEALKQRLHADANHLLALTMRHADPAAAQAKLSEAISYFERTAFEPVLPQMYLERSFLQQQLGNATLAERDLELGLRLLERQRARIQNLESRIALTATFESLFDAATTIALERSDAAKLFELAERKLAYVRGSESDAGVATVTLADAQRRLHDGTTLLQLLRSGDSLLVNVLTSRGARSRRHQVSSERLEELIRGMQQSDAGALRAADELYRLIVPDLEHPTLVVVADDSLRQIPFAALRNAVSGRFLIEERSVIEATSASEFLRERSRAARPAASSVLVLAPATEEGTMRRLYASEDEVRGLAGLYPKRVVMRGRGVVDRAVLRELQHADTVHFAGHGTFDPASGISRLVVWSEGGGATEIRPSEIANLDLSDLRLVVLAACESGKAARTPGFTNFSSAFKAAGAEAIVSARWELDDEWSSAAVIDLHRRVRSGEPVAVAFQNVLRSRCRLSDGTPKAPAEWAALYLVADQRATGARI